MVKVRKNGIFVTLGKWRNYYDRVNRKKLFEVMRGYVVHETIEGLIWRVYIGSMMKFDFEDMTRIFVQT